MARYLLPARYHFDDLLCAVRGRVLHCLVQLASLSWMELSASLLPIGLFS